MVGTKCALYMDGAACEVHTCGAVSVQSCVCDRLAWLIPRPSGDRTKLAPSGEHGMSAPMQTTCKPRLHCVHYKGACRTAATFWLCTRSIMQCRVQCCQASLPARTVSSVICPHDGHIWAEFFLIYTWKCQTDYFSYSANCSCMRDLRPKHACLMARDGQ
jgi:hypothetical protein